MNIDMELNQARNMFGRPLSQDCRDRLLTFMRNPCPDTWDDIHGIIITTRGDTLWQVIGLLDPTFPSTGRAWTDSWKMVREWSRIPTTVQVFEALMHAVYVIGA